MKNNKGVYIIAEVGVNHDGDLEKAIELIKCAKISGADCVKFQTFKADRVATRIATKAAYQKKVTDPTETQFQMLKKLELDEKSYERILESCSKFEVDFLSTPYNFEDVDFLEKLNVDAFKIASGQLTEHPFLKYVASKNRKIILSTGMATMSEVFDAVEVMRQIGNNDIIVLQCTTNYPSQIEDANIKAMLSIKEACKVQVGYSDHVANNYAAFAAVALGATVVEKHFTLNKNDSGPDHSSSLNPIEFKEFVKGIRNIEISLGTGIKNPTVSEKANISGIRRCLVVKSDLKKGAVLRAEDIAFKRPLVGLPVNMLNSVVGKKLVRDHIKDSPLFFDSVEW